MNLRGVGDRWLAGDLVDGVRFAMKDAVEIVAGPRVGARGHVMLLLALAPEPAYLVAISSGGDLRVRQSALRAAD